MFDDWAFSIADDLESFTSKDIYQVSLAELVESIEAETRVDQQFRHEPEEVVLAEVEITDRTAGTRCATGVPMPASVASTSVYPVPVHPATTDRAHDEPSEHVLASLAVLGLSARTDPLHSEERDVIDQRLVCQGLRHLPLPRRVPPHNS
jgi:hypothetical protein